MTTMATEEAGHVTDGDLVRLLDGEAVSDEARLAAHVGGCASCAARLATLRHRGDRLTEVLAATLPGTFDASRLRLPRGRSRTQALLAHPVLRAAAAILLLAGVAAATPARAWVLERVARLRGNVGRVAPAPNPRAPQPLPESTAASIVWFNPADAEFAIRFEAPPAGGTLEIRASQDPRASAQIVAHAKDEAFLVLPSELRVRNTAGSVADYRVVFSPRVRRVRVVVRDETFETVTFEVTPGMRRVIALGPGAGETRSRRPR
jgi:hypothetical protein